MGVAIEANSHIGLTAEVQLVVVGDDDGSLDVVAKPVEPAGSAISTSYRMVWMLTMSAAMGSLLFGYHVGFSSPADPAVLIQVFGLDRHMADLAWSIMNIGALIGAIICGPLGSRVGRKKVLILNSVPFVIGVVFMSFLDGIASGWFIVGRFFIGIGVGLTSVIVPLYIAEIAPAHLRGTLCCMHQVQIAGGILIVGIVGLPIVELPWWWRGMCWISLVFVLAQALPMALFAPESPMWLAEHGRLAEAKISLRLLRSDRATADQEYESLVANQVLHFEHKDNDNSRMSTWDLWRSSHVLRPVMIGISLMIFQQFSGINGVLFNMQALFEGDPEDSKYIPLIGTILVNAVQVAATLLACKNMDKFGRKTFLTWSCSGMCVFSLTMAAATYFSMATAVKVTALSGYIMMFAIGMGPLPWIISSEIYPSAVSSVAFSASTVTNWACSFIVTFLFNYLEVLLGLHGLFILYAIVCFAAMMFTLKMIPETQGLSLKQIEDIWE